MDCEQTATEDAETIVESDEVLVRTHPGLCLGWGNCHRFAPDIYPLDAEGKVDVHRLAVPHSHAYDAWLGAAACPERAITVMDRNGRLVADPPSRAR
jgi:ferredoxin